MVLICGEARGHSELARQICGETFPQKILPIPMHKIFVNVVQHLCVLPTQTVLFDHAVFLTSHWIYNMDATDGILIFIVRDRISVTKILNATRNDNKA
jgi:hypothetical protein